VSDWREPFLKDIDPAQVVYSEEDGIIICGDCRDILPKFPEKSVDLVLTDPPYNISKDKTWDKWKKQSEYIAWLGSCFLECQRVLKDNGSFYWCHNDMEQIAEIMTWIKENTKFIFKQFIVWNKRFDGVRNKGFLDGFIVTEALRNYQQMAEYVLFYTFQDETGLTTVMLDTNNFSTLRKYFKDYQEALGLSIKEINKILGHRKAEHAFYWKSTQWDLPTKETYEELSRLPVRREFVRREYESLRREYESLRYTFNNQKTHHSVWNYDIAERSGHPTPKPVPLFENIIRHSSNPGDIVLDCFIGSGTTKRTCQNLGRRFVGIEISKEYCELAADRVRAAKKGMKLTEYRQGQKGR